MRPIFSPTLQNEVSDLEIMSLFAQSRIQLCLLEKNVQIVTKL